VSKNASEYYSTHMVSYEPFECVGDDEIDANHTLVQELI
jgi:hypothetical protein